MKRKVESYNVKIVDSYVYVDIKTDRKKQHKYRIWSDTRHPEIQEVARHLEEGLRQAKTLGIKVNISEYFERMYVFIETPIKYHSNQYSAEERSDL